MNGHFLFEMKFLSLVCSYWKQPILWNYRAAHDICCLTAQAKYNFDSGKWILSNYYWICVEKFSIICLDNGKFWQLGKYFLWYIVPWTALEQQVLSHCRGCWYPGAEAPGHQQTQYYPILDCSPRIFQTFKYLSKINWIDSLNALWGFSFAYIISNLFIA